MSKPNLSLLCQGKEASPAPQRLSLDSVAAVAPACSKGQADMSAAAGPELHRGSSQASCSACWLSWRLCRSQGKNEQPCAHWTMAFWKVALLYCMML